MCGIAGMLLKKGQVEEKRLKGAHRLLLHRGPDGNGIHQDRSVGFAHTRLAIIDLSTGQQPLYNRDRSLCLIANGEIYNYIELRNELESKGYSFQTNSDCEPVLYAYEEYGTDFLEKVEGMFAFALHDAARQRLLLARDRLGIKPLYFSDTEDGIFFGSELKAIFHLSGTVPPVDPNGLIQFLQNNFISGNKTICEGIERLAPGEAMLIENSSISRRWEYWPLDGLEMADWDFQEASREFDSLMHDVILKHLRSDVPIGLYLSGGVDSSALLAMLNQHSTYKPRTYSIGFSSANVTSELVHAQAAADLFGSDHMAFEVDSDQLLNRIVHSVWCVDDLMGDYANLPVSILSEKVSSEVKVVFSGEGGDEVFAGYARYRKPRIQMRYKDLLHPGSGGFRVKPYFSSRTSRKLFGPDLHSVFDQWRTPFIHYWGSAPSSWSDLQKMQYIDLKTWLPDDLLVKADRMMMAWGVEGRVPFLDHRVVEFGLKLPDRLKVEGSTGKLFLRKWAERHYPAGHLGGRKRGFTVPVKDWFTSSFLERLRQLLPQSPVIRDWFQADGVTWLMDEHARTGRYHQHLFRLLQFAIWHRIFVERGGEIPPGTVHPLDYLA